MVVSSPISTSLSTVEVAYFDADGVAQMSSEADGWEYAEVTARILDEASAPVPNAQVFFELDAATPDSSARIVHDTQAPNGSGQASFSNAQGYATARITSQNAGASPLTVDVRAGGDDDHIFGVPEPSAATTGATGGHATTISTPTTVSAATDYTDTLFEAIVTVAAEGCTFTNCTFDVATTAGSNCVRVLVERGVRFEECTFTNSASHAITGHGYNATRCRFTEIGSACVRISHAAGNPIEHDLTALVDCLLERFGKSEPNAGIVLSPGAGLRLVRSSVKGYHEDSPNGISGYEMRGALHVFTRRPNSSHQVVVLASWLYGGEDYCVDIRPLDDGAKPSGIFLISNRIGRPQDYQAPLGALEVARIDAVGLLAQGNIFASTGLLIDSLNNRGGVGWYHPADYLDASATVTLTQASDPVATIARSFGALTGTLLADPPFGRFVKQLTGQVAGVATGQVHRHRQIGMDLTAGQAGTISGVYVDRYLYEHPTAVLYPPSLTATPAAAAVVVEWLPIAFSTVVFEANGATRTFTARASRIVTEDLVVTLVASGTATRDVDYTVPLTATILAGTREVDFVVTIIDDTEVEGSETIILTIDSLSSGSIGARDAVTLTITDYNSAGPLTLPEVQFLLTYLSAPEGTTVEIPVEMSKPLGGEVTVDYVVTAGIMHPSEWTDVTAGQITIPIGETQADIVIQLNDDNLYEPRTEVMQITLTGASGGVQLAEAIVCFLAVTDDDFVLVSPSDPASPAGGGITIPSSTSGAQIEFASPHQNVFEGDQRSLFVTLSRTSLAPITLPFTETQGAGITGADYNLLDSQGNTLTSPLTIPAGSDLFEIVFEAVDDVLDEQDEMVTLTLGAPTGDGAGLGGQTAVEVTIIDNDDPPGTGSDGPLYGLAPERQEIDFSGADIELYPDRYEVNANAGLGISFQSVTTSHPFKEAMIAAQEVWLALNAGNEATLQDYSARLSEGVCVRIRVHGDLGTGNGIKLGGGQSPIGGGNNVVWESPSMPIVRDIVIFGATGASVDILPPLGPFWNETFEITSGTYTGQRIAANVRFQRLAIEGTEGNQACVRSAYIGTATNDQAFFGWMKFYNVRFIQPRVLTGAHAGRGNKWCVLSTLPCCWDFRSCFFELAQEHAVYVNNPPGGFISIGNTHTRGGFGRTFHQIVHRPISPLSLIGFGDIVIMRNVVYDTASGDVQEGGGDFTITSHKGDIYFVENQSLGLASHGTGSAPRASIVIWTPADISQHGLTPATFDGHDYGVGAVHIWDHLVAWEGGPNITEALSLSGAKAYHFKSFKFIGVTSQQQMEFDRCGDGLNSMALINGVPANHPTHGVFWDLRFPRHTDPPWTGPISQYPGWQQNVPKVFAGRSKRLGNFQSEVRPLTDAELDSYDGTVTWPEGNRLPHAQWRFAEDGIPVGGTLQILGGHDAFTRSQRLQTWSWQRQLENITTDDFTQVLNSVFSGAADSGVATFEYVDDKLNFAADERPEINLTADAAPVNPAQPGIIRYQITDPGVNAEISYPYVDVYIYAPQGFGTFEWDPLRYPNATAEISISAPSANQRVYITTSVPTKMREVVEVSVNAASTTNSIGINNIFWTLGPGHTERFVALVDVASAAIGETLILDIESVEAGGITAGNIGAQSQLTITFVA